MQLTAKGTGLNPGSLNEGLDCDEKTAQAYQMALMQQQMLQNYSPQEAMAQAQAQYEMRLMMEMGNQLRVFASKLFR
jgi:hypothetical protein